MIVRIFGGLGNQLFQYATARNCCELNPQRLYLDVDCNSGVTKRDFELDKLNISKYHLLSNICSKQYGLLRGINNSDLKSKTFSFFKYGKENEDFVFQDISKYKYIDGYWQNESYFNNIKDILISEFSYEGKFDNSRLLLNNKIKDENSVGIHVRRGDYLSLDMYEVLSLDYFQNSINIINEKVDNPIFYIFSDDICWCKEAFNDFENVRFVEGNSALEDFELLKSCKHKIISNSTFSWWAAWLSDSAYSINIAPSEWYKDKTTNKKCKISLLNNFLIV